MLSTLDNLTVRENQDQVCVTDGGQAVGNDERRTSFEQLVEGALDKALGARVHAGGGLVQDENARIRKRGARDGKQLALSLGEPGAAFAKHGPLFFWQALDE